MKSLLIIAIALFSLDAFSQNTYINKIREVEELNIYGTKTNISIGKLIVNNSLKPKVILVQYTQQIATDSTQYWLTCFLFKTADSLPFLNLSLDFKFDKSIVRCWGEYNGVGIGNDQQILSQDKTDFKYLATQINSDWVGVKILSRYRIYTTLSGVDGILKQ